MGRPFDHVTFDCYGTLIDWEAGIGAAFESAAQAAGVSISRREILAAHAEIEPLVQSQRYRSYRDVLCETALRMARRFDWKLEEDRADFLPRSLPGWPPFADTRPALDRLAAAGYRLGILSNVDSDLLDATLRSLGVDFDLLVTAQDVRAYKPHPAHFLEARERIGEARWLHAAQSHFHDVVPSRQLKIPVAWINRHGEALPGFKPDHEFRTLKELADHLTGNS